MHDTAGNKMSIMREAGRSRSYRKSNCIQLSFWQTEFNTVFIREYNSYTHSWAVSVLESAVRGSVQMLLDIGLVDGAKNVNRRWMAS